VPRSTNFAARGRVEVGVPHCKKERNECKSKFVHRLLQASEHRQEQGRSWQAPLQKGKGVSTSMSVSMRFVDSKHCKMSHSTDISARGGVEVSMPLYNS
jgi:hypothetical protein